jgi:hypothetical protein
VYILEAYNASNGRFEPLRNAVTNKVEGYDSWTQASRAADRIREHGLLQVQVQYVTVKPRRKVRR